MDESQTSAPTPPASSQMPLGARLTNAIVAPSEVFEHVKVAPTATANWLVPLILSMVLAALYGSVAFSRPPAIQRLKEQWQAAVQKQVAAKAVTQEKADQQMAAFEKILTPTLVGAAMGIVLFIASVVFYFITVLIVWLIGRFALHGDFGFLKAMEITGLSLMITSIGSVVAMLIAVIYGNPSITPGPALLISHFDPANKLHLVLSALNLFSIWWVAVLAIGVSKVAGTSFGKAAIWLYAVWAVLTFGPFLLMLRR